MHGYYSSSSEDLEVCLDNGDVEDKEKHLTKVDSLDSSTLLGQIFKKKIKFQSSREEGAP